MRLCVALLLAVLAVHTVYAADHRLTKVLGGGAAAAAVTKEAGDMDWVEYSPDELIDKDHKAVPAGAAPGPAGKAVSAHPEDDDDEEDEDDDPDSDEMPSGTNGPFGSDEDLAETLQNEKIEDYAPQKSEALVELVMNNAAFDVVSKPDIQKLMRYALAEDMGTTTDKVGIVGTAHAYVDEKGDILPTGQVAEEVVVLSIRLPQVSAPDFMNLLLDDHGDESSLLGSSLKAKNITISGIRVTMGKIDRVALAQNDQEEAPEMGDEEEDESPPNPEDMVAQGGPSHPGMARHEEHPSMMQATLQAEAATPVAAAPAPPAAAPAAAMKMVPTQGK